MKLIGACLMVCGIAAAQGPQTQNENAARIAAGSPPIYRVTVTARTAKAISYRHRSGATKIDFRGTELLPNARGEAKVESKQGRIEIEVEFDGLQAATKNGAEYLTYVLWAVTPEGRTSNLGEVLLNGTKSKLDVSTELQVFGLVVTAEPYFAVTQPSDLIVMENVVRADTAGKIEHVKLFLSRNSSRKVSLKDAADDGSERLSRRARRVKQQFVFQPHQRQLLRLFAIDAKTSPPWPKLFLPNST